MENLFNFWINEHEVGHPAGGIPVLVLDVFEHAFMIEYGLRRADYIAAFFKNIHWKAVETRLKVNLFAPGLKTGARSRFTLSRASLIHLERWGFTRSNG